MADNLYDTVPEGFRERRDREKRRMAAQERLKQKVVPFQEQSELEGVISTFLQKFSGYDLVAGYVQPTDEESIVVGVFDRALDGVNLGRYIPPPGFRLQKLSADLMALLIKPGAKLYGVNFFYIDDAFAKKVGYTKSS